MIRFPTNYLILSGPDCAGKTNLYSNVHRTSGFKWNIQDRSWLSMLIYGILYGRPTSSLARGLWEELTCLNNRVILSLPPWQTIKKRFEKRGDDFQNEESLKKIYTLFEEYDYLQNLPNVMHLDNSDMTSEEAAEIVTGWVKTKEEFGLDEIAAEVLRFVSNDPSALEARDCESTLNFTFYETIQDGNLDQFDPEDEDELLSDPVEGEYYTEILEKFIDKVKAELKGENEYSEPQAATSRRFVFADDRCISFIQAMVRKGVVDFHVVIRSSNVASTFHKDLRFLYCLANSFIQLHPEFVTPEVRFRFNINSAHLVR